MHFAYLRWRLAVAGGVGESWRCIGEAVVRVIERRRLCGGRTAHRHVSKLRGEVFNLQVGGAEEVSTHTPVKAELVFGDTYG